MKKYLSIIIALALIIIGVFLMKKLVIKQKAERLYETTRFRNLPSIIQSKTFIVGTTINPISFYYYKDTKAGFEYEIAQDIAKKLNLNLQIITVANDSTLYSMMRKGQIDMAMNKFLSIDNHYSKDFEYTNNIYKSHLHLISFSNKDTSKTAIDKKIAYSKVIIPSQDFNHLPKDYISKYLPKNTNLVFDDTASSFELMRKLANKDSIMLLTWDYMYELSNLDEIKKFNSKEILTENEMTFIVANQNIELLDTINFIIEKFKNTKKYSDITKKYLQNNEVVTIDINENETALSIPKKYRKGAISLFDELIKKHAKQNKLDWKLVAAVIYKESSFNPQAISPYGASGLMQLMPETGKRFGADSLLDPEQSIKAGCAYLKYLNNYWSKKVNDSTQIKYFVLASYNSGQGHIIDAQKLAEKYNSNPNIWFENVELYLSLMSDPKYYNDPVCKLGYCRASETISFVRVVSAKHQQYKDTVK